VRMVLGAVSYVNFTNVAADDFYLP
jgi:hypothetical protein